MILLALILCIIGCVLLAFIDCRNFSQRCDRARLLEMKKKADAKRDDDAELWRDEE